jgi:small subunit ribosomal protein S1
LSREKAIKQKSWNELQDSFDNNKVVTGIPFNRVKGGMSVDLDGVVAFLPGSQIDTRQIIKDTKELLNKPLETTMLPLNLSIFKIINSSGLFNNSFVSLIICLVSI